MAKERVNKSPAGLAVPAGLLMGMGIGFLSDAFLGWMFLGIGAGFAVLLILRMLGK